MQITSLVDGQVVSGIVDVLVDSPGTKRVAFYIDGVVKGHDPGPPFKFSWYTTNYPDGIHEVKAVSGNGKLSDKKSVNVQNAKPVHTTTVTLTGTPQVGSPLTGKITVT